MLLNWEGVMVFILNYFKLEKGESYQVEGFIDVKGVLLKVVEYFNDGNEKNNGMWMFYLQNGKFFYMCEKVNIYKGNEYGYYDCVFYYLLNGEVLKIKECSGSLEEEVE